MPCKSSQLYLPYKPVQCVTTLLLETSLCVTCAYTTQTLHLCRYAQRTTATLPPWLQHTIANHPLDGIHLVHVAGGYETHKLRTGCCCMTPTAQPVAGAIPLPTWCNGCTYATPHSTVPVIRSLSLPTRTPTSLVHTTLCW